MEKVKDFLKKKNIEISAKRYFIDTLGAMAQGLFASLLIGTIIGTLGAQLGIEVLVTIGNYAKSSVGAAVSSGMGTCGLVGQIGIYTGWVSDIAAGTRLQITSMDWIGLIVICFMFALLIRLFA